MVAKYIDREALEKAMTIAAANGKDKDRQIWARAIRLLNDMPVADVAPVVHGRWVPTKVPFMNECEDCSVCGYRTVWGRRFNYCPNCGAKMDEKEAVYD